MAKVLGVATDTIFNWENGKGIRYPRYYPRILDWLGYDPFPEPSSSGEEMRFERYRLGLTSQEMASCLGIDQSTLLNRENR